MILVLAIFVLVSWELGRAHQLMIDMRERHQDFLRQLRLMKTNARLRELLEQAEKKRDDADWWK